MANLFYTRIKKDHLINDENGRYQPEYEYYIHQTNTYELDNIERYYYLEFDLGDVECLIEDDLFQDTWLVAGKSFANYIDYFWDAEITDLYQNVYRDFYTKYRDGSSEDTRENYSKFRCLEGDSGFIFCKKESCEDCNHVNTKKIINPQYKLWEKYVEPLILA